MTMAAAGVAKLIEEMGELHQALGKKLAWWNTNEPHWDGTVLNDRIVDEMADVHAAIYFVLDQLGLDEKRFDVRSIAKGQLFTTWAAQINNNDHGIDAPPTIAPPGPPESWPFVLSEGPILIHATGTGWVHIGPEPPA